MDISFLCPLKFCENRTDQEVAQDCLADEVSSQAEDNNKVDTKLKKSFNIPNFCDIYIYICFKHQGKRVL